MSAAGLAVHSVYASRTVKSVSSRDDVYYVTRRYYATCTNVRKITGGQNRRDVCVCMCITTRRVARVKRKYTDSVLTLNSVRHKIYVYEVIFLLSQTTRPEVSQEI